MLHHCIPLVMSGGINMPRASSGEAMGIFDNSTFGLLYAYLLESSKTLYIIVQQNCIHGSPAKYD